MRIRNYELGITNWGNCLNQDLQDFGVVNNQENHINPKNHGSDSGLILIGLVNCLEQDL